MVSRKSWRHGQSYHPCTRVNSGGGCFSHKKGGWREREGGGGGEVEGEERPGQAAPADSLLVPLLPPNDGKRRMELRSIIGCSHCHSQAGRPEQSTRPSSERQKPALFCSTDRLGFASVPGGRPSSPQAIGPPAAAAANHRPANHFCAKKRRLAKRAGGGGADEARRAGGGPESGPRRSSSSSSSTSTSACPSSFAAADLLETAEAGCIAPYPRFEETGGAAGCNWRRGRCQSPQQVTRSVND